MKARTIEPFPFSQTSKNRNELYLLFNIRQLTTVGNYSMIALVAHYSREHCKFDQRSVKS